MGFRLVVSAILENAKGEIYLQERWKPHLKTKYNGLLEIPAGGVEAGEYPHAAIIREVQEETGLSIVRTLGGDKFRVSIDGDDTIVSFAPFYCHHVIETKEGLLWTGYIFNCLVEGEIKNQEGESRNGKFYPREEVVKMVRENPERFFFLHLDALRQFLSIEQVS